MQVHEASQNGSLQNERMLMTKKNAYKSNTYAFLQARNPMHLQKECRKRLP